MVQRVKPLAIKTDYLSFSLEPTLKDSDLHMHVMVCVHSYTQ